MGELENLSEKTFFEHFVEQGQARVLVLSTGGRGTEGYGPRRIGAGGKRGKWERKGQEAGVLRRWELFIKC